MSDLAGRLNEYRKTASALNWEGSFEEYLEMVRANPRIARLAHARLNDMIMEAGVEEGPDGVRYRFFEGKLFGIDRQLREIMDYFRGAAAGLDVRKRVLLLIGPPGTGKSSLLIHLKRGLEAYTRTDAGALYAIKDCPMHEEPLHLIPHELREEARRELGVVIEGDLCPVCQMRWREAEGDLSQFRVQRIVFSERDRIGIGTFTPGDPKDLDTSLLVGGLDFAKITQYGSESDPRAFRFDGEFNVANRGLMEEQEWLKQPKDFMALLLTLAQEQNIKTGRYALIYADEVVIAHSNLYEYERFIANPENDAMKNRVYMVTVPYALRVQDEERIYRSMLSQGELGGIHIAPYTLEMGALAAVLTRLEEPRDKGLTLMDKVKLYNGDRIKDFTDHQVEELHRQHPNEGLSGISPRDTMNVLTYAMGQSPVPCVNPIDLIRGFRYFAQEGKFLGYHSPEAKKRLLDLAGMVREEYDRIVKKVVMTAFVHAFEESAQSLFTHYLDHAEASVQRQRVLDPVTGEPVDPDEGFMRSIEEQIGVSGVAAKAFREEILVRVGAMTRRGEVFHWDSHPRLKEAIEKKLFGDVRQLVQTTTTNRTPDPEKQKRLSEVQEVLMGQGFCPHCANAILDYAGSLLQRE
ncbi:serine protein kinase (involved in sporulation) [Candidatus Hydrogenisulfobacillus filiaventi]|uniref:Serine protein kinase (Involved in sporulation) n=1 Tax=Candidatus Hydrogenisulfobacillus filiaventi TaxID=2707344 RepID=A0A6F8ZGB7_9FIRM|nr:protein prkA [Bacillota bacterium]CAB1129035.1 serine protein kinase (involved in sporulation) [Candidatus Hydrogenisulfobacillus filiaventi]